MLEPRLEERMVWMCPLCEYEWDSKELKKCPRCQTPLYAPRPTFGLMYPLIAAMQMIDDGHDPKDGLIDATLDRLLEEQIRSVGGERPRQIEQAKKEPIRKRVIVVKDESEISKNEINTVYIKELSEEEAATRRKSKCILCSLQTKTNQRLVKLDCGHVFHSNCISTHLKRNSTCPECRKNVG